MPKRRAVAFATEWLKNTHAAMVAAITPNAKTIAVIFEGMSANLDPLRQQQGLQGVAFGDECKSIVLSEFAG